MAQQASCSVAYFCSVLETSEAMGVDPKMLLDRLDLSDNAILDPNKRLPMEALLGLLELSAELSSNQDFGLQVGLNIRAGSFGLLGYLSLCSRNMREASELMLKFKRIVFDAGSTFMHEEEDMTVYTWQPLKPEFLSNRYLVDAIFSGWVCFSNMSIARANVVKRLELSYPEPENIEIHQQLFGCNLVFSCPQNKMYIATDDLNIPSPQANETIFSTLNMHARDFLYTLNSTESTTAAVRYHLFCLLPKGDASIDAVALQMNVNRRTLQRKLSAESNNFRTVVNGVREELSEQYLRDKSLSMLDIAMLLGFSDSSAFTSWFRSCRSLAPTEYRESLPKS